MPDIFDKSVEQAPRRGGNPPLRAMSMGRRRGIPGDSGPLATQRQVAQILTERGRPITCWGVGDAERRALRKLWTGLMGDPYIREWLREHHLGHVVDKHVIARDQKRRNPFA